MDDESRRRRWAARLRRGSIWLGVGFIGTLVALYQLPLIYQYDPRRGAPNAVLIRRAPEVAVTTWLDRQLARDGTYPSGSALAIVGYEATHVAVYPRHGGSAAVHLTLRYSDGAVRQERFYLPAARQRGFVASWLPEIKVQIEYGFLADCRPTSPGSSLCRIASGSSAAP